MVRGCSSLLVQAIHPAELPWLLEAATHLTAQHPLHHGLNQLSCQVERRLGGSANGVAVGCCPCMYPLPLWLLQPGQGCQLWKATAFAAREMYGWQHLRHHAQTLAQVKESGLPGLGKGRHWIVELPLESSRGTAAAPPHSHGQALTWHYSHRLVVEF